MKVLLVNGSSHAHGTTARALDEMIGVFQAAGVETEVIQLGGSPIADCLQCGKCAELGRCVIDGDGVNAFVEKAAHPSGRIFSFLDRVFFSNSDVFMFKPGAAVAVARRAGTTAALDALNKYFGISQMPVAGSTYWNMVHGRIAVDAEEDLEGLQTMRNLARNMIWMMRCFELGQIKEERKLLFFVWKGMNACLLPQNSFCSSMSRRSATYRRPASNGLPVSNLVQSAACSAAQKGGVNESDASPFRTAFSG